MAIQQVKFVGICVSDQARALDFYTRQLGFTVRTDQPFEGGQRWVELGIPGAETGVVLFTPKGQEDRIVSFVKVSFTCDDLEATYQELEVTCFNCLKKRPEALSCPGHRPFNEEDLALEMTAVQMRSRKTRLDFRYIEGLVGWQVEVLISTGKNKTSRAC